MGAQTKYRVEVEHIEQTTGRTVEEVASALEAITGDLTDGKDQRDVGSASTKEEFAARVERFQSDSGFMRFLALNHGEFLSLIAFPARRGLERADHHEQWRETGGCAFSRSTFATPGRSAPPR